MGLQIYPAIDLRLGMCVRLKQGDYGRQTVYNENPAQQALLFAQDGATWLHVVDLDGAKSGAFDNRSAVRNIINAVAPLGVRVQLGGGVRNIADIEDRLALGCSRVIIGSMALHDIEFVAKAIGLFGGQIAVGVDAKNGLAAGAAWETVSEISATSLAAALSSVGAEHIIYTDIERDGMMRGPDIAETRKMAEIAGHDVISGGGVSNYDDIRRLSDIGCGGVIIGSALYSGDISLKRALAEQ